MRGMFYCRVAARRTCTQGVGCRNPLWYSGYYQAASDRSSTFAKETICANIFHECITPRGMWHTAPSITHARTRNASPHPPSLSLASSGLPLLSSPSLSSPRRQNPRRAPPSFLSRNSRPRGFWAGKLFPHPASRVWAKAAPSTLSETLMGRVPWTKMRCASAFPASPQVFPWEVHLWRVSRCRTPERMRG